MMVRYADFIYIRYLIDLTVLEITIEYARHDSFIHTNSVVDD